MPWDYEWSIKALEGQLDWDAINSSALVYSCLRFISGVDNLRF